MKNIEKNEERYTPRAMLYALYTYSSLSSLYVAIAINSKGIIKPKPIIIEKIITIIFLKSF
ncbi:MAG: hypothetical protein IIA88_08300 [Bacteroidetes bacterium]|nr:hypothetical protein [Bacteroidota bacterium]